MSAQSGRPFSVLFVCLGNICRSPMAEGALRAELDRRGLGHVSVDSAGTGAWHVGEAPSARAVTEAGRRGIDISGLRGRQVGGADFGRFDFIVAMDRSNLEDLRAMAPAGSTARVDLFSAFAPEAAFEEVPDPYYGDETDYTHALDLIEAATAGLADRITRELAGD